MKCYTTEEIKHLIERAATASAAEESLDLIDLINDLAEALSQFNKNPDVMCSRYVVLPDPAELHAAAYQSPKIHKS